MSNSCLICLSDSPRGFIVHRGDHRIHRECLPDAQLDCPMLCGATFPARSPWKRSVKQFSKNALYSVRVVGSAALIASALPQWLGSPLTLVFLGKALADLQHREGVNQEAVGVGVLYSISMKQILRLGLSSEMIIDSAIGAILSGGLSFIL
jgi:hypothetical protein